MREKRRRSQVVGVAEGSGGVRAWLAGLEAAVGATGRNPRISRIVSRPAHRGPGRPPPAVKSRKRLGGPFRARYRWAMTGDAHVQVPPQLQCGVLPGQARRAVLWKRLSAARVSAPENAQARDQGGDRLGHRPHRLSAEVARAKCLSRYERFLADRRPPPGRSPLSASRRSPPAALSRRLGRPAASRVKNPTGKCWPLRANTGRSSSTCRTAHIDGSPTERTRHRDSAGFR